MVWNVNNCWPRALCCWPRPTFLLSIVSLDLAWFQFVSLHGKCRSHLNLVIYVRVCVCVKSIHPHFEDVVECVKMPAAFELLLSAIAMTQNKCWTMVIALVNGNFAAVVMHPMPWQSKYKVNKKYELHKNAPISNIIRNIFAQQLQNESFPRN